MLTTVRKKLITFQQGVYYVIKTAIYNVNCLKQIILVMIFLSVARQYVVVVLNNQHVRYVFILSAFMFIKEIYSNNKKTDGLSSKKSWMNMLRYKSQLLTLFLVLQLVIQVSKEKKSWKSI